MGESYIVINLDKMEFIGFPGYKLLELVDYPRYVGSMLFWLLADGEDVLVLKNKYGYKCLGSWSGDRIVFIGSACIHDKKCLKEMNINPENISSIDCDVLKEIIDYYIREYEILKEEGNKIGLKCTMKTLAEIAPPYIEYCKIDSEMKDAYKYCRWYKEKLYKNYDKAKKKCAIEVILRIWGQHYYR